MKKTDYILFGASGDLARRYLLPALQNLNFKNDELKIIPVSRKNYAKFNDLIDENREKVFHLAIPPVGVPEAIELIAKYNKKKEGVKVLLEKPFGSDLASARNLIEHIDKYFEENQIYRVDHYLAKKSLRNFIKEKWSMENIESIEIIASEKIGIEGRTTFYEQTGALRDFVQNHLLQMVAITLAQSFEPEERYKALKNLEVVCDITKSECVKRAQYKGYTEEVGNPESMTETFVSINMVSNDPSFRGVAINLTTGKALKEKLTQIKIKYKNGEEKVFRIEHEADAYERVIEAALSGTRDEFISSAEILESWRILDAVQQTWKNSKEDIKIYEKGSAVEEIINDAEVKKV